MLQQREEYVTAVRLCCARTYVRQEADRLLDHKQTVVTVRTKDCSLLGHETMSLGE